MIRNDWPETLTSQEVFDHVVSHLRQQGVRATYQKIPMMATPPAAEVQDGFSESKESYVVKYCAAGCLFTVGELLSLKASGRLTNNWARLIEFDNVPKRLQSHSRLISQLQSVHDDAPSWNKRETLFENIAHDFKLKFTSK